MGSATKQEVGQLRFWQVRSCQSQMRCASGLGLGNKSQSNCGGKSDILIKRLRSNCARDDGVSVRVSITDGDTRSLCQMRFRYALDSRLNSHIKKIVILSIDHRCTSRGQFGPSRITMACEFEVATPTAAPCGAWDDWVLL